MHCLVAAKAMDREGRPRSDILAFTLPGFATGDRTKGKRDQAVRGARGHVRRARYPFHRGADAERDRPPLLARRQGLRDVTFENVQAWAAHRLLVPAANQRGGIVLGTGDLSELALGWSTYGWATRCRTTTSTPAYPKRLSST